jgi:hypothetical protein
VIEIFTAILTMILVAITGVYAYLTYRMAQSSEASVEAMSQQHEMMSRPYITITPFVRPHTTIICLRISNTGKSVAKNVLFTLDRDIFQYGEENLSYRNLQNKSVFQNPIDSLPPGIEISFALTDGKRLPSDPNVPGAFPVKFTISASYEFFAKTVREEHHIDLGGFHGSEIVRNPVVEELERIRKQLTQMTSR